MRHARYKSGRTRIARADLPVRRGDAFSFDGAENERFGFDWGRPVRKLGQGFTPGPLNANTQTVEQTACEVRGRFNNCDVYIVAPFSWIDPTTVAPDSDATVRLSLFAMLQGTEFPIHDQQLINPGTLPDLIVIPGSRLDGGAGASWRAYALKARGRPCDGFRVKITTSQTTIVPVVFDMGQISIFAWGEETSSIDIGSVTIPADVNATIVGPSPLPVSGTVTVLEQPATAGLDLVGTAPTGGVATALAAHAVQREVMVLADAANAAGSTVEFSFAATTIGSGSIPLGPGDSKRVLINDTSKLFVNGSAAGLKYRVSVT